MDKGFLDIYEDELAFLRDMGAEFADAHPKIAGRLKLDDSDVRDPYVERLLEGFAFLTARVRLRMQSQYPEFTQNLLSLLYPNFTAPIPSCAVFEFSPDTADTALVTGHTLPRGLAVMGRIEGEETPCEFTLSRDVTLRPLIIDEAVYTERTPDLERWFPDTGAGRPVEAAIRVRIRVAGGATLDALELSDLSMFVAGEGGRADRILRAVLMDCPRTVTQPVVGAGAGNLGRAAVAPLGRPRHEGFSEHEAMLPSSAKTFSGHRLLQEVFTMPEAFRFIGVDGFRDAFAGRGERAFDLVFGLAAAVPEFADWIGSDTFRLHCGPAINLFTRRADRINVQPTKSEHLVVVDRTRPQNFEVHSVESVEGIVRSRGRGRSGAGAGSGGQAGSQAPARIQFQSVFQPRKLDGDTRPASGYFNTRREQRLVSTDSRSTYAGTDVHLRMVQPGGGPIELDMDQLVVSTTCTNRGLPTRLGNKSRYSLRSTAPISNVRAIIGPTAPRPPMSQGSAGWDLINALSLNHLSFDAEDSSSGAWLNRLMELFIEGTDAVQRQLVGAFTGLSTSVITRRLPGPGPVSYGRGLEITVQADVERMRGTGPFVLASVLEHFLRRAATLNAFTQTALETADGEELARWPVRMGGRHVL